MPENDGKVYGFATVHGWLLRKLVKIYILIDYEMEDRCRSNLGVTPCSNPFDVPVVAGRKKESSRLSSNMKSLCTGLEEYKIRDSLNVVENHVLRLNIKELKELRSADAKLIKELNLRPKEVEYITTTKVVTKDSIVFVLKDSCFNYSDKWVDFYANIPDSTFVYEVRDSLSSAISRIYKHRFLWWRWGTKGYRQTIVNHNPHSRIIYNEIVKVES